MRRTENKQQQPMEVEMEVKSSCGCYWRRLVRGAAILWRHRPKLIHQMELNCFVNYGGFFFSLSLSLALRWPSDRFTLETFNLNARNGFIHCVWMWFWWGQFQFGSIETFALNAVATNNDGLLPNLTWIFRAIRWRQQRGRGPRGARNNQRPIVTRHNGVCLLQTVGQDCENIMVFQVGFLVQSLFRTQGKFLRNKKEAIRKFSPPPRALSPPSAGPQWLRFHCYSWNKNGWRWNEWIGIRSDIVIRSQLEPESDQSPDCFILNSAGCSWFFFFR